MALLNLILTRNQIYGYHRWPYLTWYRLEIRFMITINGPSQDYRLGDSHCEWLRESFQNFRRFFVGVSSRRYIHYGAIRESFENFRRFFVGISSRRYIRYEAIRESSSPRRWIFGGPFYWHPWISISIATHKFWFLLAPMNIDLYCHNEDRFLFDTINLDFYWHYDYRFLSARISSDFYWHPWISIFIGTIKILKYQGRPPKSFRTSLIYCEFYIDRRIYHNLWSSTCYLIKLLLY